MSRVFAKLRAGAQALRRVAMGTRFARSLERHEEAARQLDMAVREVLNR